MTILWGEIIIFNLKIDVIEFFFYYSKNLPPKITIVKKLKKCEVRKQLSVAIIIAEVVCKR